MSTRRESPSPVPFLFTFVGAAGVNIRKMRAGILSVFAVCCALSFFWHDPHVVSLEAALLGGFVGTFLYLPVRSLRLPPQSAKVVETVAALVSLASLFFIGGKSTEPVDLLFRFVAGFALFGSVIVADRLRALRA